MVSMKTLCICFAGVPGCDKSSVAYRLSWELGMPIFSNDAIRKEIKIEHEGELDIPAYDERRKEYMDSLFSQHRSFIYDASVDRRWEEFKQEAGKNGYDWLLISFDLSPDFVRELGKSSASTIAEEHMINYHKHHQKFLEQFGSDATLRITDDIFSRRFELALEVTKELARKG